MELKLTQSVKDKLSNLNLEKCYKIIAEIEKDTPTRRQYSDKENLGFLGVEVKDPNFWNIVEDGDVIECFTIMSAEPIYLGKFFWVATSYDHNDLMFNSVFDLYERDMEVQNLLAGELIRIAHSGKVCSELAVNNFTVKEKIKERRTLRLNYKAAVGVTIGGQTIGVATCLRTDIVSKGRSLLRAVENN